MKTERSKTNQAIDSFIRKLRSHWLDQIINVKLFGSCARGDNTEYSDIDLLVIVKQKDWNTWFAIQKLASEISLKYDLLLSTFIMSGEHVEYLNQKNSPFIRQVHEQGKELWVK